MSTPVALVFAGIDAVPLGIDDGHRRLPGLLATLAAERIVLVFCSSRTRAEIEGFRQSVGVFHPFVCEGGAAAFVPSRYYGSPIHNARAVGGYEAIEFAIGYDALVAALRRSAEQLRIGIRGFADMSIEQVARECGLSLLAARLAKLREYGEPFRLLRENPVAESRLLRTLASAGISCRRQGGFLHAASIDGPAAAVGVLTTLYRTTFGSILTASSGMTAAGGPIRVDVQLDSVRQAGRPAGETVAWIEQIVDGVRAVRRRQAAPAETAPIGA